MTERLSPVLWLLLLVGLVLPGCFTLRGQFGAPIPVDRVQEIRNGETTREQITAWFGPPSAFFRPSLIDLILASGDEIEDPTGWVLEDVYSYRFIQSRLRLTIIPLALLRITAGTETDSLIVFFDQAGRVRYHAFRRDRPDAEVETNHE